MMRRYIERGLKTFRKKTKDNKSTFSSFENFIPELMELLHPIHILEFGPGISTKKFLEYSSARILSFETDPKWFKKYKNEIKNQRFKLIWKEQDWNLNEIKKEESKFDFVFVDGGDRIKELKFCKQILSPNGVVFLHDAHREDYFDGIIAYTYIFFIERHSCLLLEDEKVYNRLKERITPDYSCNCQYCSTEERRAYFSQFIGAEREISIKK